MASTPRYLNMAASLLGTFLLAACNSKSSRPAPPAGPNLTSIEKHADWLLGQITAAKGKRPSGQTSIDGLAKSYESAGDFFAHTYNQAQGAMALLIAHAKFPGKGYDAAARAILTALQANQNADGSFSAGFHIQDETLNLTAKQTGGIAFAGLAINLYTRETGDRGFVPLGESIADYLSSIALSRPAFPGKALPNANFLSPNPADRVAEALSGEENLAAFAFLIEFADITGNSGKSTAYRTLAGDLRLFLESLWNNAEGRFNAGRNSAGLGNGQFHVLDPKYFADVQTAGVLALGTSSSNGLFDFTRALDPAQPRSVKTVLEISSTPKGIAFGEPEKAAFPDTFDAAQTARYGLALKLATPNAAEADTQLVHADAITAASGGIPLFSKVTVTNPTPANPEFKSFPSVEATSEKIFAQAGVNFYRAAVGATQFFTLDLEFQRILLNSILFKFPMFDTAESKEHLTQSLRQPLGEHTGGRISLFEERIKEIERWIELCLPSEQKRNWGYEPGELHTLVLHHEKIVHAGVEQAFNLSSRSATKEKLRHLSKHLYSFKAGKAALTHFTRRVLSSHYPDKELPLHVITREDLGEFIVWLISWWTYRQSGQLQFGFNDYRMNERIKECVLKHFPELEKLFEQKIEGATATVRRKKVDLLITKLHPVSAFERAL